MIFKVDFEKAFDSVRCDYLDDVLKSFGFGNKWRGWIRGCLNSAMGSILCFFMESGLKINIHKNTLARIGVCTIEVDSAARFVGCSTFTPPFNYLEVKVGGVMSRINSWDELYSPVSLSIFKVPMGVLKCMESIRRKFFNGVEGSNRKMELTSWNNVLASKKKDGLGVSSFFVVNNVLMFKWVWHFITQGSSLWSRFIKVIHGIRGVLDCSSNTHRHSPWLDIIREISSLKSKKLDLLTFVRKKMGNGEDTTFWDEVWLGEKPMKLDFPRLYALESCKLIRDRWHWSMESTGVFSVKSVRNLLDDSLLHFVGVPTRWVKVIPIKVNVFAWRLRLDNLPSQMNLSLRVRRKVLRWWHLDDLEIGSYDEWILWLNNLRLSSSLKTIFEGACYVMWWILWRLRNHTLFGDTLRRRETLFDDIVQLSFNWCCIRCKSKLNWTTWMQKS
ncbi:hypothetical protein Tco_1406953 [Tanacetum coccineum]